MAKKANGPDPDDCDNKRTSLETCLKILGAIQDQIRFADSKAAFLMGINTLMFGFMATNLGLLKKGLNIPSPSAAAIVALVALIVFALCVLVAVLILVYAVMSRFGDLAPMTRMFFGHIAKTYGKDYGKYVTEIRGMTDDEWLADAATQIVETSHIAAIKHRSVKKAAIASIVGLIFWVVGTFSVSIIPAHDAADDPAKAAATAHGGVSPWGMSVNKALLACPESPPAQQQSPPPRQATAWRRSS